MKFNFLKISKKHNQSADITVFENTATQNLPEEYRGMQIYESDSDRFCTFDEDYFAGEDYDFSYSKSKKKRRAIPPPKTHPSFLFGALCGAILIFTLSGGIAFLSLFSKFGGIYTSVTVPSLTSLSEAEAISLIKDEYSCFDYSVVYKENPSLADGAVISQIPKASTSRKLYGINGRITIKLTVNRATEPITLPNVVGQSARDVMLELKNAGINVKMREEYSDTVKAGNIISSSHKFGSTVYKNETVYITSSLGKRIATVKVPSVLGSSESAAIAILKEKGLNVSKVIYKSSTLPLGTVIEQSVDGGVSMPIESRIELVVSG